MSKIWYGDRQTSFELYVGALTQFEKATGRLIVRDVVIVAEDIHEASIIVAMRYPEWDIQTLTCISDLPWFLRIELNPECPQVAELREALLEHIVAVPIEEGDDI